MSLRDYIVKAAENKKGKIVEPKKEVESKYSSKQSNANIITQVCGLS